jgi:hypothetical protein
MQSIRLRPIEQERCNALGWDNYLGEKVSLAKQNTGETIPVQSPAPSYLSPYQEQIASEETHMELPAYKRPPRHLTINNQISTEGAPTHHDRKFLLATKNYRTRTLT